MTKTIYLLTGDIGGTNSRMALYETTNHPYTNHEDALLLQKTFRNAEHIGPATHDNKDSRDTDPGIFALKIIRPFLQYCFDTNDNDDDTTTSIKKKLANSDCIILATLATAGVVDHNRAHLTNLGNLLIDGTAITKQYHDDPYISKIISCRIINDFVAVRF